MLEPIFHQIQGLPARGFILTAFYSAITDIHPYNHPLAIVSSRPTLHLILYHARPLLKNRLLWDEDRL